MSTEDGTILSERLVRGKMGKCMHRSAMCGENMHVESADILMHHEHNSLRSLDVDYFALNCCLEDSKHDLSFLDAIINITTATA